MLTDLVLSVNGWAILVAALAYFLLGSFWYSVLFSKKWMQYRGVTEEELNEQTDQPRPLLFIWTFLLQLIAVTSLALFTQVAGLTGAGQGAMMGFGFGAGILFTLTAITGLFAGTKLGLHFIDNGYHVIGLILAGAILGAW